MLETLCQVCRERPAASHLMQVAADGSVQELHICPHCVEALHLDLHRDPPDIDAIRERYEPSTTFVSHQDADEPADACPTCGMTWREFRRFNRFGCAQDFSTFADRIDPYLAEIHDDNRHHGRLPAADGVPNQAATERHELERQLKEAIAREEFERAAELRDQIHRLAGAGS